MFFDLELCAQTVMETSDIFVLNLLFVGCGNLVFSIIYSKYIFIMQFKVHTCTFYCHITYHMYTACARASLDYVIENDVSNIQFTIYFHCCVFQVQRFHEGLS